MRNPALDNSIKEKLVCDGSFDTTPAGVHPIDLFVGDVCIMLDLDRPAEDRGSSQTLIAKYSQKLGAAGYTVVWNDEHRYAVYKSLSQTELDYVAA